MASRTASSWAISTTWSSVRPSTRTWSQKAHSRLTLLGALKQASKPGQRFPALGGATSWRPIQPCGHFWAPGAYPASTASRAWSWTCPLRARAGAPAAEPAARHLAALGVVGAGVSAYGAEVVVLPSTTELGEAEQSDAPPVRVGSAWFPRLLHLGLLCRIAQLS